MLPRSHPKRNRAGSSEDSADVTIDRTMGYFFGRALLMNIFRRIGRDISWPWGTRYLAFAYHKRAWRKAAKLYE